jgi:hypothetical protein
MTICFMGYDYIDKITHFKMIVKRMINFKMINDIEKLMAMKRSEIAISFSAIFNEDGGHIGK